MKDVILKIGGKEIESSNPIVIGEDEMPYVESKGEKHPILRFEFKSNNEIKLYLGGCDLIVKTTELEHKRLKAMIK